MGISQVTDMPRPGWVHYPRHAQLHHFSFKSLLFFLLCWGLNASNTREIQRRDSEARFCQSVWSKSLQGNRGCWKKPGPCYSPVVFHLGRQGGKYSANQKNFQGCLWNRAFQHETCKQHRRGLLQVQLPAECPKSTLKLTVLRLTHSSTCQRDSTSVFVTYRLVIFHCQKNH